MADMKRTLPVILLLSLFSAARAQEVPWGELTISVTETPSGKPIPAKVCVLNEKDGTRAVLLSQSTGSQVIRPEAAYTLDGKASLRVLAGEYRVLAGRGMEYSTAEHKVSVPAGGEARAALVLERELDTKGFVAADLHLHTVFSDGDTSPVERVIALAGEGVEFGAATDHEHVTDYDPAIEGLGAGKLLKCVPGDEISTWETIGHFCAFPVPPGIPAIPNKAVTGAEMFAAMRSVSNRALVQVNHPRWNGGAYFTHVGLGPFTGRAGPKFDPNFDLVEIMNEDQLWGWDRDPQVRSDWFNLLNRGLKFAAVANSDSHGAWYSPNGMPRTYIASSTDDPAGLEVEELMDALRRRECTTASGVFLEMEVNGRPAGGLISAKGGKVRARIRAQAPSWLRLESVALVVNGEVAETMAVPAPKQGRPTMFEQTVPLALESDSWIVALAEGPGVEHPLYPRPVLPRAATNPIWVDVEPDGMFEPLLEQVRRVARRLSPEQLQKEAQGKPAAWLHMLVGELYDRGDKKARAFLNLAAESPDRGLRAAFLNVTTAEAPPKEPLWAAPAVEVPAEEWGKAEIALETLRPADGDLKASVEWEIAAPAKLAPARKGVEVKAGAQIRETFAASWPADSRNPPRFSCLVLVTGKGIFPHAEKLQAAVYPALRLAKFPAPPVLDGRLREWPAAARVRPAFGATVGEVYLARWGDGLYFAAQASDKSIGVPDRKIFWKGDSLELFIDSGDERGGNSYRPTSHHIWICPVAGAGAAPAFVGRWHHDGDALAETVLGESRIEAVCRSDKAGYVLEGMIPLSILSPEGEPGDGIYFNYGLTDKSVGTQFLSAGWDEQTNNRPGTWAAVSLP